MAKEQGADEVKKKVGNTYVTKEFRHKDNFEKAYEVDQDISDEAPERIAELVGKGLAETIAEPAKPAAPSKPATPAKPAATPPASTPPAPADPENPGTPAPTE